MSDAEEFFDDDRLLPVDPMPTGDTLHAYLTAQGYDAGQIALILAKVAEYDHKVMRDSIFDSIDMGSFKLESIIQAALASKD